VSKSWKKTYFLLYFFRFHFQYSLIYYIIEGMEGYKVDDPESVYVGKQMKNGWKNSGSPRSTNSIQS